MKSDVDLQIYFMRSKAFKIILTSQGTVINYFTLDHNISICVKGPLRWRSYGSWFYVYHQIAISNCDHIINL